MAINPTGLNRRNLAGAALLGLTALAGGSAPPPNADAKLIAIGIKAARLRREHAALMRRWWAIEVEDPGLNDLAEALEAPYERLWQLSDLATAIPALGPDGWKAKAEIIRHFLIAECEGENGEMTFASDDQKLAWSLICDMTGGA